MTVKEQVKEFVHDVKHRFSHHKHHHRGESSASTQTLVSDGSSHTAYSGSHSRPGSPDGLGDRTPKREPGSQPATPEHAQFNPVTPERKRVLSTSSHKHSFFHKLRRKSSNLSIDARSGTPERESFPGVSQPGTPEPSATLSNPGTPESSLFGHGGTRQRVPSTPSRKHNVLHKLRRASSHFKSHSDSHAIDKAETALLHHQSSLRELHEHDDVSKHNVPETEPVDDTAVGTVAKDSDSVSNPPSIIVTSPPVDGADTMDSSGEEGGDAIDPPEAPLEPAPNQMSEKVEEGCGDVIEPPEVPSEPAHDTVEGTVEKDIDSASNPPPIVVTTDEADALHSSGGGDIVVAPEAPLEAVLGDEKGEEGSDPLPLEPAHEAAAATAEESDGASNPPPTTPLVDEADVLDSSVGDVVDPPEAPLEPAQGQVPGKTEESEDVIDPSQVQLEPAHPQSNVLEEPAHDTAPCTGEQDSNSASNSPAVIVSTLPVDGAESSAGTGEEGGDINDVQEEHAKVEEGTADEIDTVLERHTEADIQSETLSDISGTLISPDSISGEVTKVDSDLNSDLSPSPSAMNTPDPFILDDDDNDTSDRDQQQSKVSLTEESTRAPAADINKPTPAPPASSPSPASGGSIVLPRLTAPSMFLPIPNTDPLSALLTKHVPPERRPQRDVTGEWASREMHEMVMSNSWRALAKMARDLIVACDPEDLPRILDLWSLRLSSLARLRLTNQASAECTNLFAVLNAVPTVSSAPVTITQGTGGSTSALHIPMTSPPLGTHAQLASSPAAAHSPLLPSTPTRRPSPLPTHVQAAHLQPHAQAPAAAAQVPQLGAPDMLSAYPFELSVLRARVRYWAGDVKGYIDALAGLLVGCKAKARAEGRVVRELKELRAAGKGGGEGNEEKQANEDEDEDDKADDRSEEGNEDTQDDENGSVDSVEDEDAEADDRSETEGQHQGQAEPETLEDNDEPDDVLATAEANLSMWLERAARVCLMIASQLVEMKDYHSATKLLEPLCTQHLSPSGPPTPSPSIHSAVGRIYLLSGNMQKATEHFRIVASCPDAGDGAIAMNTALMCSAVGDWSRAEAALREVLEYDPQNYTATNNLAVTLLAQGRVKDGIELLESAVHESPASVLVAEPFIFNISTLYELRSSTAMDNKRELLIEVAKWSGDGLKATCLKMPPN